MLIFPLELSWKKVCKQYRRWLKKNVCFQHVVKLPWEVDIFHELLSESFVCFFIFISHGLFGDAIRKRKLQRRYSPMGGIRMSLTADSRIRVPARMLNCSPNHVVNLSPARTVPPFSQWFISASGAFEVRLFARSMLANGIINRLSKEGSGWRWRVAIRNISSRKSCKVCPVILPARNAGAIRIHGKSSYPRLTNPSPSLFILSRPTGQR